MTKRLERVAKDESPYQVSDISLEELERGLRINEDNLEDAWKDQPESFYRVSKKLALLISQRDEAKRDLALIEAEADEELRKEARENEVKTTEREIESKKMQDKQVLRAQSELSKLSLKVSEFNALVDAFKQRQSALIRITDLHMAEFYEPKEPRARGDLIDHKNRATKEELRRRRLERD